MADTEPIVPLVRQAAGPAARSEFSARTGQPPQVVFDRRELNQILNVYGHKVAAGEWRDYAIDFGRDKAVFAVFRRSSEVPLYRIEKNPRLTRRQGAYAVVAQGGMILRRGHDLAQVLRVFLGRPKLVVV